MFSFNSPHSFLDPSQGFWHNLLTLLSANYPPQTTKAILEKFNQEHVKYITNLNLDNIEKLSELAQTQ